MEVKVKTLDEIREEKKRKVESIGGSSSTVDKVSQPPKEERQGE